MTIGHDEIDLDGSPCPEVFQHTEPALFTLLGTGPQCQHLLVASQVHSQGCEDHRRIGLVSMTHTEMDPIQAEDAPVLLQTALPPGGELLLEILVATADSTGGGGPAHRGLGQFSDL